MSGHVEVTAEPKVAENVKKKVIHKMYTVVCFFFYYYFLLILASILLASLSYQDQTIVGIVFCEILFYG